MTLLPVDEGELFHSSYLLRLILIKLVFDGIDQSEPAGFDDVFTDADGAPDALVVARFDDDADAGRGARFAVDDANFVVDQAHILERRKIAGEGLAHRGIKGVDRAVALGHFEAILAAHA